MRHRVKSVQIRSLLRSVFSCIQTEFGPEKTPYMSTFYAVRRTQNQIFVAYFNI